ncbi:MAG: glycosyltransferase family 4 protein [Burkholderiales bacterium]|nr:glycosyltransferase family 4 protein [Anaerolineae bacterium]
MHIGLNAHLLSGKAGYRSAGIHGYIYNLLANLPTAAPPGWDFTAFVGANNAAQFDGITMCRSRWDTESPLKRIVWEQAAQPFSVNRFDLYHALAFVAPIWLQTPSVVTIYDLSFLHYPQVLSPARRLYLRLFTGLTCRRARRVIAISHSTAQDVAHSLGIAPEKIDVAAPGYDADVYQPLASEQVSAFRAEKGLPERFWLFLGTLEPRKNLPTLLNAYAALPKSERLPLVLGGGKGWQYDDIFATITAQHLEADVLLPGFIPAAELPLWYNSAEVFVYPSVFEGFGLPVLEAMACGTPVMVADSSSLLEVVGAAGLRVPPHNVAAWTAALQRALTDDQWREQSREQGLQEARRYSWRGTAERTVMSYRRALAVE